MATSLKRTYASILWVQGLLYSCPWPHGTPLLTHTSAGDCQTLTGKSGSVSWGVTAPFSWVLVHTRCCALRESVSLSPFVGFPGWEISCRPRTFATVQDLLWYNCSPVYGLSVWWLYMALMVTSTERTDAACCASHICCSQSPCPCGRSKLTHASAGDT